MLTQDEELWEKKLPSEVEGLLGSDPMADRGGRSKAAAGTLNTISKMVKYLI